VGVEINFKSCIFKTQFELYVVINDEIMCA